MLDINRRIKIISDLIEQGTQQSVSYAALECRLTIEYLCYERLQIALDLVSFSDLKGWQPGKVVRSVGELVTTEVSNSFTIMISAEPLPPSDAPRTLEEFQNLEYHPIGTQSAINLNKIVSLWNALANAALHVQVPKEKSDSLSIYGDIARTTAKVYECIAEFRQIASGTLLSNGFGREVSIKCSGCGRPVRRREELLTLKQIVSCVNPNCEESYTVEKGADNEITFERRIASFKCGNCEDPVNLPLRKIEKLKLFESVNVDCPSCSTCHLLGGEPVYKMVEKKDGGM
jgi:hypothetical protein